tara:strand:+ start:1510 stop:2400 length:891 start_codon:yes stop_codon:yes gene_type:complete
MSGGSTNTIQSAEPFSGQQPFILDVYNRARNQADTPREFFPGKLYADPTQTQLDAENLARMTALGGQSAVASSMIPALQFQFGGPQNLASNPYIAGATEAAIRPLFTQTQSLLQQARRDATGAGQLGSDRQAILESNVIGNFLQRAGDISSNMYSRAYGQALEAQTRSLATAPQSLGALQIPASQLAAVGAAEQARIQQAIDARRAAFEFGQVEPRSRLAEYSNLVAGSILPGNTSARTDMGNPLSPNTTNTTLAALAGAGGYMYGTPAFLGGMQAGGPAGLAAAAGAYLIGSMFN